MEDTKTQSGRGRPQGNASEFGEVRVISKPAPDAEDRLRRLFTLLLRPPSNEGENESAKDPLPDDRNMDNQLEAEA